MSEDKLKKRLAEFMSQLSVEPSKKELDTAVKGVFNDKKKAAKESDDKPKRKLSAWNIFYKEQSAILKQNEEGKEKDERMSAKEKMAYIASLWKNRTTDDEFKDTVEEPVEEPEPEPESEPEPEPEVKPEPKKENKKSFDGKKGFKNGPKKGAKNDN
jgi:hypothetical protein